MKLDEKLVRLRKEKGLTQLELAEAVKVSRQAVSKWEAGGSLPSTENLKSLSEIYGVPVDYLLNDLDDIEHEEEERAPSPLEPGNKDTPEVSSKNTKKGFLKCSVLVLILAILVVFIGVAIAIKNKESLRLEDVSGEEVTVNPRIEFNLEW